VARPYMPRLAQWDAERGAWVCSGFSEARGTCGRCSVPNSACSLNEQLDQQRAAKAAPTPVTPVTSRARAVLTRMSGGDGRSVIRFTIEATGRGRAGRIALVEMSLEEWALVSTGAATDVALTEYTQASTSEG
jgi:hypothetical protein